MALAGLKDAFFSEKFWLPPNVTWADLEDKNYNIPKIAELWYGVPLAFVFLLLRIVWTRTVAEPIGRLSGLSEKKARQPVQNDILEKAFKKHNRILPSEETLEALVKQTDFTFRQIERWWQVRRVADKPTELQRFAESSYRSVAYLFLFVFGVCTVWGESHIWDTKQIWHNFPKQSVSSLNLWFFCLEIGFYLSLLMSAAFDNRQKDFMEMMVHHVTSLLMFYISWLGNFVRVATLTVVLHDSADPFLDAAKVAKYLRFHKLKDVIFVIFTVIWIMSRLVILPLWTGRTSFFEGHKLIGATYPAYWLLFGLYGVLQLLHFYWFTFIARVIYHYIILKKEISDERSDTEPESDEDDTMDKKLQSNGVNGINGVNGVNGINGVNGVNGISGVNGVNGVNGHTSIRFTNNNNFKDSL